MPVYFIHGFRWPRPAIRIHIILHNLEDSAAEWLVAPGTTREMLDNFNTLYPESMEHLQHLRFVEQYDPNDTSAGSGSQPYAYVADVVEEVKLGVDIDDIRGKGVPNDQWASLMELRDKLAPEEKVAWYIVVCGDEERWAPTTAELAQQEERALPAAYQEPERQSRQVDSYSAVRSTGHTVPTKPLTEPQGQPNQSPQGEQPRGIKKLFSSVARRKSRSRVRDSPSSPQSAPKTPPISSPTAQQSQTPNGKAEPVSNGITLQTTNLNPANAPNSGDRSAPSGGSAHSWEADDEHEVITGPTNEDDSLAAPSPTVRHGREADIAIRNKRFSKFSVYPAPYSSTIRTVSPEAARSKSPQGRNGNNLDSIVTNNSADSSRRQSLNFSRNSSPRARTPTGANTPATYKPSTGSNSGTSTPATYHTAHDRNSHLITPHSSYSPSANNSRQSLAQPPPSANISRSSLIMPNHQQQQKQHSVVYQQRPTVVTNNSRTSLQSQATRQPGSMPPRTLSPSKDVSKRASQQTMSGMSPTVQALYGQHERDWNKRQSVRPDDLVARGLDEGVFAGLR